jgi:choline-phosphate cytidylyltransferase
MKKVITYGTFDLLHYGHINLLKRAKSLGDYLIVGVTSEDFDKRRGKINVQQSLMERIEAIKDLNIADEIIVEEYDGQKIDDIKRYDVEIFTVGSDWVGKFDYLSEFCKVIYLDRTDGVSSSDLRSKARRLILGLAGDADYLKKIKKESEYINGIEDVYLYRKHENIEKDSLFKHITDDYESMLKQVDAVYIHSYPEMHYELIKKALLNGKHVLCEAPLVIVPEQVTELRKIALDNNCILMNSLRTAYSTAYTRLLLLIKSGMIGSVVSIDATCTSQKKKKLILDNNLEEQWNSICEWGPTAMLPIFQIFGTDYLKKTIVSSLSNANQKFDLFTKIDFIYSHAVASIKVGQGVKSEGELIISGTDGYIYVPAPWWKTDYFEVRYENQEMNRRYFYQLDGEGIRYLLLAFCKFIETGVDPGYFSDEISKEMVKVISDFDKKIDFYEI